MSIINKNSKQGTQFYRWCFTFNNYEQTDIVAMRIKLGRDCKKYIFQEETGAEGTKHLQGSCSFKAKRRLTELKKIDERIHWEPTKNVKAADAYACKEETRTGKVFTHEKKKAFIRESTKFDNIEPRKEIIELIEREPDNRTINWVWSAEGGVGKTSTCAYIEHNYENVCIANGKGTDIKNHVITHLQNDGELDVLIINVPRCNEGHVSYAAIEEIKDGLIYSGKYEGGFANIEHPHVIVIANQPPEMHKMSEDRWNIINLDPNNKRLPPPADSKASSRWEDRGRGKAVGRSGGAPPSPTKIESNPVAEMGKIALAMMDKKKKIDESKTMRLFEGNRIIEYQLDG